MTAIGKRLGQTRSPIELTEVARKGDRVLGLLTASERQSLARNALRFVVDQPCRVFVAAPKGHEPFWIRDQGFSASGEILENEDGLFSLFYRDAQPGTVGLGVNALDRSTPSHYAVFVQGSNGAAPQIKAIEGESSLHTVAASTTVSPFADVHRPFRQLPKALVGSTLVQTRFDDRHDALLATGRVWKARQPSGPRPDQVVVSFGDDPTTSLSFTWRTEPSVKSSRLRLAPVVSGEGSPGPLVEVGGQAWPIESDGLLNDPVILRHGVLAAGLKPGMTYRYSVGDGSPQGWTDWAEVATAPRKRDDFGFLYMGDAQCGLEKWGELLKKARPARPDARFLILAGDLVDRGNERTNWDHFFLRAAGVFEGLPLMPAVGNHEYLDKGAMIYSRTFRLPGNGPGVSEPNLVYSFEYSDAFFAVLDSTIAIFDPNQARAQAEWLDQALSRTKANWKFVSFHHPLYASHVSRENPQLERAWGEVFDRHHVDMVLQGHDHAYLRTHPMKAGQPVSSDDLGTTYVVAVSGEKFYEQNPRSYTAKGLIQVATYQTIDIQVAARKLTYRAFDRDGHEVDQLVIDKGRLRPALAGVGR